MRRKTMQVAVMTVLCTLVLSVYTATAAIKVIVEVHSYELVGSTLTLHLTVRIPNKPVLGHPIATPIANIADSAAIVAAIKTTVITFAQNQHGVTIAANEIAVFNGPQ